MKQKSGRTESSVPGEHTSWDSRLFIYGDDDAGNRRSLWRCNSTPPHPKPWNERTSHI